MAEFLALKTAISDLDESAMKSILERITGEGSEAKEALTACQEGMTLVGDRFESGEYYIADLIYAGELMVNAVGVLKQYLVGESSEKNGRMILCTVKGDLHDIGKNIVKSMLEAASIEVLDLGIDVAPDTIVKKAMEHEIKIIGLSGVLSLAVKAMKDTVDAFAKAGMRDNVKIIIGGASVNDNACDYVGADTWAYSPYLTVKTCSEWVKENR